MGAVGPGNKTAGLAMGTMGVHCDKASGDNQRSSNDYPPDNLRGKLRGNYKQDGNEGIKYNSHKISSSAFHRRTPFKREKRITTNQSSS